VLLDEINRSSAKTQSAMLEAMDFPTVEHIFQPEAPFTPFDCTELKGGPIGEITLGDEG